MGISYTIGYIIRTSILFGLLYSSFASSSSTMSFRYHNGTQLHGRFSVNLVWYGNFKPAQRAIIADFVQSLTSASMRGARPSVVAWWNAVGSLYRVKKTRSSLLTLSLGKQVIDERYSLGKSLSMKQVENLANKGGRQVNAVNVVLTSDDVAVQGMCSGRCGTHASSRSGTPSKKKHIRYPYVWVGNSGKQCPGQCTWPFHRPIYGPQGPPLVAPNGDVGLDGMVINLASLLAGTATNPFGNGYFQGPKEAPLEAATACTGVYGKGAYPGYAGKLLVDRTSGASYNANGVNGRKFLLPALYDPKTSTCFTLV